MGFQVWDSLQAVASYIREMLTQQAILKGVGVGQQDASALSAVTAFFLRDLSGMVGGVAFATIQGGSFDSEAKQWRFLADVANNVALALDLVAISLPRTFFLASLCLSSVARSVVGVAAGAARAALTVHFSKANKPADISAKEGSQEVATRMLGMSLGLATLRGVGDSLALQWTLFLALSAFHIYSNIRAMRNVHLHSLNRARLELVLTMFTDTRRVLTPQEAAAREPLLPPALGGRGAAAEAVALGVRLRDVGEAEVKRLPELGRRYAAEKKKYLLLLPRGSSSKYSVLLHEEATDEDVAEALTHALVLRRHLAGGTVTRAKAEALALEWMRGTFATFRLLLRRAGWDQAPALRPGPHRVRW